MKTDFFTQLPQVLNGHDATMTISQADGKLTISFLPSKKGGKVELIPLNMDGTPEEFNDEFLTAVSSAVEAIGRKGIVTNKEEFEAAAEAPAAKTSTKSSGKKKPARASQNKNLKTAKPAAKKPAVKPVKEVAKGKKKPVANVKPASAQQVIPLETEVPVIAPPPPPEPVKHSDADLAEFKGKIENKLVDAKEEFVFIRRAKEKGSSQLTPEQCNEMFDIQENLIKDYERALKRIDDKTYGVRSTFIDNKYGHELIDKAILLENLLTIE
jgi:PRTRC genetic system protein E